MKFDRKDMIDLNETNISDIFRYCIATRDIEPRDLISTSFFSKDVQIPVPEMKFSQKCIEERTLEITYMLCQLECIHKEKLTILLDDGFKKYDGTVWTTNKAMVFSLYYLCCATGIMPEFKPVPSLNAFASVIGSRLNINATLSPADPSFNDWAPQHTLKRKS